MKWDEVGREREGGRGSMERGYVSDKQRDFKTQRGKERERERENSHPSV